jgi:hypothetical protein
VRAGARNSAAGAEEEEARDGSKETENGRKVLRRVWVPVIVEDKIG